MGRRVHYNQGLAALPPERRWATRWPHARPLCNRHAGSVHSPSPRKPVTSTAIAEITCKRCLAMLDGPHAWRLQECIRLEDLVPGCQCRCGCHDGQSVAIDYDPDCASCCPKATEEVAR